MTRYQGGTAQENNALKTAIGNEKNNAENGEKSSEQVGGKAITTMQDWQVRFRSVRGNTAIRDSASQTYADIRQQSIRYIFDLLFGAKNNRFRKWAEDYGSGSEEISSGTESGNMSEAAGTEAVAGMYTGMYTETAASMYTGRYIGTAAGLYTGAGAGAGAGGVTLSSINTGAAGNEGSGYSIQNGELMMNVRSLTPTLTVLSYSRETYAFEAEETKFSTTGTVRTSDGREINFNVNVGMSRTFEQYYREDIEMASFTLCDPLVINLDTDVAELEDQTFYFDIDADGELDEVSQLGRGSGYLSLDKNGDGVINDGSELFGTASGNGFADLAKYDEDGNGWIDENDAIWDKLKIWAKDENGRDVLYRLAEKGVGAICLQNAATDFTQKNAAGQTLGAIRNTGVFLYENGNVGTVQHVDVAKYYKEA